MCGTRKTWAVHYVAVLIVGTVLAQIHTGQVTPTPATTKHNGKIVFTSDRQNKGLSIWTMNPDGSSPTRLTDDKSRTEKLPNFVPVYDSNPVWSPDGTKIAFISNRNYLFSLYVMNADGANARLVTDKVLDLGEPAWSPDGGKIAFTGGTRGSFGFTKPSVDVYIVNVDGSGLTKLTKNSGVNSSPTWSPDGKQIAFSSNRDAANKSRVWVMNADGSNQRMLPNDLAGREPAWSPDGTRILFTSERACEGRGAVSIYVMNADGSNSRLLSGEKACGRYDSPKWSPDGARIVAMLRPEMKGIVEPAKQIVVMNADGANQVNISNRGKYYFNSGDSVFIEAHPDWQPVRASFDFGSSVVGFSAPAYTGNADAESIPITVRRSGNLNSVASCSYVALTSEPAIKYANGMVRFAAGESSTTISIPVNAAARSLKTSLTIVLSDNDGNATFVGGIKEASLTIVGKEAAARL